MVIKPHISQVEGGGVGVYFDWCITHLDFCRHIQSASTAVLLKIREEAVQVNIQEDILLSCEN